MISKSSTGIKIRKVKKKKKGGNRGEVKGKLTKNITFYLQSLKAEYLKGEQNKNDGQVIKKTMMLV